MPSSVGRDSLPDPDPLPTTNDEPRIALALLPSSRFTRHESHDRVRPCMPRPRRERQATPPLDRPPTFSGFVLRLLLYLFVASLLFSLGGLHQRMVPIQQAMASVV